MKKLCSICSNEFESKRIDAKYCSNNCKQKAHYQREIQREEQNKTHPVKSFNWDEFKYVYNSFWKNNSLSPSFNAIEYFFLTQSLKSSDWDDKYTFMESLLDKKYNFDNAILKNNKAFEEFKAKFFNGEYELVNLGNEVQNMC